MSATREDDHLVFLRKFSSVDYLFVYDSGDNNFVGLIQPTTDIADTLEVYMPYEDVVDTTGDYILEVMELKYGNICDDSDYSCGGGH